MSVGWLELITMVGVELMTMEAAEAMLLSRRTEGTVAIAGAANIGAPRIARAGALRKVRRGR